MFPAKEPPIPEGLTDPVPVMLPPESVICEASSLKVILSSESVFELITPSSMSRLSMSTSQILAALSIDF